MQQGKSSALMSSGSTNRSIQPLFAFWHEPGVTVARLAFESYFRSGWLWGEVVLVLAFFAALFFPFREYTSYFYGTSIFDLGGIAILGTAILVRQATSARTYLLLARLTTRAAYSRGLFLASAVLRIPLFLLLLLLVLLAQRLLDPAPRPLLIGAIGLLPNCILLSALAVTLSSPIARRIDRILFLAWLALVLFSFSPIINLPMAVINILSIVRLPLWPVEACYTISATGIITWQSLLGLIGVLAYIVGLTIVSGHWLERRDLLLY